MKYIIDGYHIKDITTKAELQNVVSVDELKNKKKILDYLKNIVQPTWVSPIILVDPFTNESYSDYQAIYEKDGFTWDKKTVYMFEKYNIKLSDEFLKRFH